MRMRALAPPVAPAPPMNPTGPVDFPAWTPEAPGPDDFAEVAAQARIGVQQKTDGDESRQKRMRVIVTGAIAVAVAGVIFVLVQHFYDPAARARERAIADQIKVMAMPVVLALTMPVLRFCICATSNVTPLTLMP